MACNCNNQNANNCGNSNPIELIATGAQGTAGVNGADATPPVIYNNHTDATDINNTSAQTLKTTTLDNTPTPVMADNGDYLLIETYFTVGVGTTTNLDLNLGTTTLATVNVTAAVAQDVRLWAVVSRTAVAAQQIEGFSEVLGLPSSITGTAIASGTENFAVDLAVNAISTKSVSVGAADVTCKYLRITLFNII